MKRIGEFQIIAEIHGKGISKVFKAYQSSLDRIVLLKTLHPQFAGEEDLIRRFEREARACARLNHANIVAVYAYGVEEEIPYIAMEFIDGESIAELLKRDNPMPVGIVVHIVSEVTRGLETAHKKGILHRDIKPSNILISYEGDVKITDFGLATLFDVPGRESEKPAGTPSYMAPEQLLGEKLTGRVDLFSLGATFYEMITGEPSFGGETLNEKINCVLHEHPPPPDKLRYGLPGVLSDLILQMLEKDPQKRIKSPKALIRSIEAFQRDYNVISGKEEATRFLTNGFSQEEEILVPVSVLPKRKSRAFQKATIGVVLTSLIIAFIVVQLEHNKDSEGPEDGLSPNMSILPSGETPSGEGDVSGKDADPKHESTWRAIPPPHNPAQKDKPSKAGTGQLMVNCSPWADIYIDGHYVDTTPLTKNIYLRPGTHVVTLMNSSFPEVTKKITVSPGEVLTLDISFWDYVGKLQISVKPWARIFIDGNYIGTIPIHDPILLPPGRHRIQYRHPDIGNFEEEVEIRRGDEIGLSRDLEKLLQEQN